MSVTRQREGDAKEPLPKAAKSSTVTRASPPWAVESGKTTPTGSHYNSARPSARPSRRNSEVRTDGYENDIRETHRQEKINEDSFRRAFDEWSRRDEAPSDTDSDRDRPREERDQRGPPARRGNGNGNRGRRDFRLDDHTLRKILRVLLMGYMTVSRDMRDIMSAVMWLWLIPTKSRIITKINKATKSFHDAEDKQKLAAPFIQAFVALMKVLYDSEKLELPVQKVIRAYYDDVIARSSPLELQFHVKYCRVRVCKKTEMSKLYMVFTPQLENTSEQFPMSVAHAMRLAISTLGGDLKRGSAPRGGLEREAADLMSRLAA